MSTFSSATGKAGTLTIRLKDDNIVLTRPVDKLQQALKISFQRTVRVADNGKTSNLPAGFGKFPLKEIENYAHNLPNHMVRKGGFFFPMYSKSIRIPVPPFLRVRLTMRTEREAMWIKLTSTEPFALKVYVGGINAISGEPAIETEATVRRRLDLLDRHQCIQDYVITPDQKWIDGVACENGTVRQFVAVASGSGYSIETQLTGRDHIAGLQFEVTPMHSFGNIKYSHVGHIFIRALSQETVTIWCEAGMTIADVKSKFQAIDDTPPDQQRLIFAGKQLEDNRTLADYRIRANSTIHQVLRLRGGASGPGRNRPKQLEPKEMAVAAGGKINQTIRPDTLPRGFWDADYTTAFNVQILDATSYRCVTGEYAPESPINEATYADKGLPFFAYYNELPTGIRGNFQEIRSVNELDRSGKQDKEKIRSAQEVNDVLDHPTVLLDLHGRRRGFRSVGDLKDEVESLRKCFRPL